jgi:hypothetical protein
LNTFKVCGGPLYDFLPAMWALREQYTAAKATPAIVKAFQALQPSTPPPDYQDVFLKELVAAGLDSATVNRLVNP